MKNLLGHIIKVPIITACYTCLLWQYNAQAQPVPISSIYQNLKKDPSTIIKSIYTTLHAYYNSQITAKELAQKVNAYSKSITNRENAIKNMALSYAKIEEEDFGFYNLRLAVSYADHLSNQDIVKGVVYAEFGNYLFNRETHDLAIEFLRKSIPILDTYKPTDIEGVGFSLQNKILRSFAELSEKDSVAVYMDKVIDQAKSYKDKIWLSSAYNNKGYRFFEENKLDSALIYYTLAQSYLILTQDEHIIFYENINENIAHIHAKKKEYTQALLLLNKVIEKRLQYPEKATIAAIKELIYYIKYGQESGQVAAAINKFNQTLGLLKPTAQNFETSKEFLQLKMQLAQLTGDRDTYLKYFNLLLEREKERLEKERKLLVNRKGINKYIKARNDVFEQQLEIEKLQKAKLRQSVTYRNIFIGILILISGLIVYGIYAYNKYKKKLLQAENEQLLQREKILDLENINLKTNIERKEKDISKVVADNKLRTEIKKDFLKKLEQLNATDEKKVKTEIKKLSAEMEQTIDQHEKIDLLQQHIEDINTQFESKLRETIPGITQSEIEICALIRLGYNNTEIANIVNKSAENVRVNKFRIKQKAGLDDMKDLEILLKEM
jgi:hypothetical protein